MRAHDRAARRAARRDAEARRRARREMRRALDESAPVLLLLFFASALAFGCAALSLAATH